MSPRTHWLLLPCAAAAAARVAAAVLASAVAGCQAPTAPANGQLISPPPVFSVWWQEVQQCSGLSGDLDRVRWYVVPCEPGEPGFVCEATADGLCGGEWVAPHTILLGGPNKVLPGGYVEDEWTVKHEMLHDLTGSSEHPDLFKNCHLAIR